MGINIVKIKQDEPNQSIWVPTHLMIMIYNYLYYLFK